MAGQAGICREEPVLGEQGADKAKDENDARGCYCTPACLIERNARSRVLFWVPADARNLI